MRMQKYGIMTLAVACMTGAAMAQDAPKPVNAEAARTHEALSGAAFIGTYLRDNSPYTLEFGADGKLADNRGQTGRWWIRENGDYCREWTTGAHAGKEVCMEILVHGERMALYANNERVIVGELKR